MAAQGGRSLEDVAVGSVLLFPSLSAAGWELASPPRSEGLSALGRLKSGIEVASQAPYCDAARSATEAVGYAPPVPASPLASQLTSLLTW